MTLGHPDSVNLTFNKPTLVCTSTGGPATTVTWKKDGTDLSLEGAMNQIITDTQTAEYETKLTLSMTSIEDYTGKYECIIENNRGSASANLQLEGKINVYQLLVETS